MPNKTHYRSIYKIKSKINKNKFETEIEINRLKRYIKDCERDVEDLSNKVTDLRKIIENSLEFIKEIVKYGPDKFNKQSQSQHKL
jgi:archaellum component FlaC